MPHQIGIFAQLIPATGISYRSADHGVGMANQIFGTSLNRNVDAKIQRFEQHSGSPGVINYDDRIRRDAADLQKHGIGVVAISANDIAEYPQDAPAQMKIEAARHGFTFPYLYDETQTVARAYGAECTPDFFGYNANGELQYRGRLDASGRSAGAVDARRELNEAMVQIAETGQGPREQIPSMGCSIKWKA